MKLSEIKNLDDVRQWLREQDPWAYPDPIMIDEAPNLILEDEAPIETMLFNHYMPKRCFYKYLQLRRQ